MKKTLSGGSSRQPDLTLARPRDRCALNEIPASLPSPLAISAGQDLVFEGLVETGSLGRGYSQSLTEAAWRGDQPTVEIHLRQLRACVVAGIGIFKQLKTGEARRE